MMNEHTKRLAEALQEAAGWLDTAAEDFDELKEYQVAAIMRKHANKARAALAELPSEEEC